MCSCSRSSFGLIDCLDNLDCAFVEYAAVLGRSQFARRAIEETHTKMTLEFLDPIAGNSRRSALVAPGGREVSKFDDSNKNTKVIKVRHYFRPKPYTV